MGDLEKIPPNLLKEFDEIRWESVESKLKLGHYGEKKKKYATLYVDYFKAKRDAVASLPLRGPRKSMYQGDILNRGSNAVRALFILAIILIGLSACKTTWQPPPGTGDFNRWGDNDHRR